MSLTDRLALDPTEERVSSQLFLPFNASLLRKCERETFQYPTPPPPEPSDDDESDRRYSDVSVASDHFNNHLPSYDRVRTLTKTHLSSDLPNATHLNAKFIRDAQVRSFSHTISNSSIPISSIAITPSSSRNSCNAPRQVDDSVAGASPVAGTPVRNSHRSIPQPKRYEYYCSGIENNPTFFSAPVIGQPQRPQPIRPRPTPSPPRAHQKKRTLWNLFSSKRSKKRERPHSHPQTHQPSSSSQMKKLDVVKEKRSWSAADPLRRLRRSSRHASNLESLLPQDQQPPSPPSHFHFSRVRGRVNSLRLSQRSSSTMNEMNTRTARTPTADSPSMGNLHCRERFPSDTRGEPKSFSAYRTRMLTSVGEGSSVSSASDREEELSNRIYMSRRNVRLQPIHTN